MKISKETFMVLRMVFEKDWNMVTWKSKKGTQWKMPIQENWKPSKKSVSYEKVFNHSKKLFI